MHFVGLFVTASMALTAAAVPVPASTNPAPPCASTTIKQGQSTAFGWQLVGTSSDASSLDETCGKIANDQASKWGEIGLSLERLQTPVCNAINPKASDALPRVITANTDTVKTLFENAFSAGDSETYGYLCENLRYEQVSGFSLNDMLIINATCNLSTQELSPKPFESADGAEPDKAAVAAYNDAQSKLYAYLYAAQASSPEQLSDLCQASKSKKNRQNYRDLFFDADCVSQTICSIREPLSVEDGKEQIKKYTSMSFANVLVHSSNAKGYKQKLCEKLDVQRLEAAGVDGELVRNMACDA
ncbi:hypothetical protein CB0940_10588 [Cercospora beticola]|uniref:Uncharacterized protein n=1 Tax=Cercospora beticola TaxID=122368 RepID=A0A2G5HUU3_CERBT|nr:hypothetical protein CB0940_10588 [Cercospora beticola]PIA96317.1 hypothetical protein CB0940_10588 [Cercospora beticola]WPB07311.1 hypothetical protein RHO25_011972 [Cercospora beticola]